MKPSISYGLQPFCRRCDGYVREFERGVVESCCALCSDCYTCFVLNWLCYVDCDFSLKSYYLKDDGVMWKSRLRFWPCFMQARFVDLHYRWWRAGTTRTQNNYNNGISIHCPPFIAHVQHQHSYQTGRKPDLIFLYFLWTLILFWTLKPELFGTVENWTELKY